MDKMDKMDKMGGSDKMDNAEVFDRGYVRGWEDCLEWVRQNESQQIRVRQNGQNEGSQHGVGGGDGQNG